MGNLSRRFSGTELVPDWWHLSSVESLEDIVFLGEVTVRQMIRHWRGTARSLVEQIKKVDAELELVRGLSAKDFQRLAADFEHPIIMPDQIGERDHNWSHDPEPIDDESANRERGSTTFNICGWCKYASGGTGRYGYMITTGCSLLYDADIEDNGRRIPDSVKRRYGKAEVLSWEAVDGQRDAAQEAVERFQSRYPDIDRAVKTTGHDGKTQRRFNTPCFLRFAYPAEIERITKGLEETLERLKNEKKIVDEKIKLLLHLVDQAERKPALPSQRPYDWFNLEDPLTCFLGNWEGRTITNEWATAVVIDGYRHHDGCVSVRYDSKVHDGEYLEGHGGGYGMSRPEVMHTWEFDYLREHPDFAQLWVRSAYDRLEGYDPDKLFEALMPKSLPNGN